MTALRAVSGVLAGGLVALLLVLGAAWFVARQTGTPGPGPDILAWHAAAAVVAVLAQRHADRHPGAGGPLAALVVTAVAAAVLAVLWLA